MLTVTPTQCRSSAYTRLSLSPLCCVALACSPRLCAGDAALCVVSLVRRVCTLSTAHALTCIRRLHTLTCSCCACCLPALPCSDFGHTTFTVVDAAHCICLITLC